MNSKSTGFALVWLGAALAWTALRTAGVYLADWSVTVLALAAAALVVSPRAPRLERWIAWPMGLLAAWVLIQLVPLPNWMLLVVSPARAALTPGLAGPISVDPAATLAEWMRLAGAILTFLLIRELAWRLAERDRTPWQLLVPVVILAALEAALGLLQYSAGAAPGGARGTYVNRNHFAGLMEMALPFPILYGYSVLGWAPTRSRFDAPLRPALLAAASFGVAALLLFAAIHSLSRMGFIACVLALGMLAAAAVPDKRWLLAAPVAVLAWFIYLPSNELIARFAELAGAENVPSQDRLEVWKETLPMIMEYKWVGCGLGSFEHTFTKFKRSAPLSTDNYAHNDYLQYLAELGWPALLLTLTLIGSIMRFTVHAAFTHSSPEGRALALACLASISALLLHSTVDFNSYIPLNSMVLAWIAAVAVSVGFSSRPPTSGPVSRDPAKAGA